MSCKWGQSYVLLPWSSARFILLHWTNLVILVIAGLFGHNSKASWHSRYVPGQSISIWIPVSLASPQKRHVESAIILRFVMCLFSWQWPVIIPTTFLRVVRLRVEVNLLFWYVTELRKDFVWLHCIVAKTSMFIPFTGENITNVLSKKGFWYRQERFRCIAVYFITVFGKCICQFISSVVWVSFYPGNG